MLKFFFFFFFFTCGCPNVPALFVKKTIFAPLYCIYSFVKKSLDFICVGLFLGSVFYSINLFICSFVNTTHFLLQYLYRNIEIRKDLFCDFYLFLQYCVDYPGSFDFLFNIRINCRDT